MLKTHATKDVSMKDSNSAAAQSRLSTRFLHFLETSEMLTRQALMLRQRRWPDLECDLRRCSLLAAVLQVLPEGLVEVAPHAAD